MDAVGANDECEIDVVVDDEQGAVLFAEIPYGQRIGYLIALFAAFVSPLEGRSAAFECEARHLNRAEVTAGIGIDDDVEAVYASRHEDIVRRDSGARV